jgi:hypothetical protein
MPQRNMGAEPLPEVLRGGRFGVYKGVWGVPGGDESPQITLIHPKCQTPYCRLWWEPRVDRRKPPTKSPIIMVITGCCQSHEIASPSAPNPHPLLCPRGPWESSLGVPRSGEIQGLWGGWDCVGGQIKLMRCRVPLKSNFTRVYKSSTLRCLVSKWPHLSPHPHLIPQRTLAVKPGRDLPRLHER